MVKRCVAVAVVCIFSMGTVAVAETVTVGKSGAQYTSIQAAINAINATDGDPDVVQILDGAVYEEQVMVGGLPPIDQAYENFIGDLVAQNRDPITIIGPETGDRPAIAPNPEDLLPYGVFEDDFEDNFNAGLVFFGKNITFENLAVQQPTGNSAYSMNGQGVEITFRNVLFGVKPGGSPEEDMINLNNSDRIADYYNQTPNDILFDGCIWDGTTDGGKYPNSYIYYHGTSGGGVDGVEQKNITPITFRNCTFQNAGDNITRLRSQGAEQDDVNLSMIGCLIKDNDGDSVQLDGGGIKIIDQCVFVNNVNNPEDLGMPTGDNGAIHIRERSGRTGTVTISNSIFSNNASLDASTDAEGDQWAAILVQNGGEDDPLVIDHCTFDGNGTPVRFADGSARPRTATISNSIFSNNIGPAITGNGASPSYIGSGFEADLALTVKNCLFYNNGVDDPDIGTNVGAVPGDPAYANTDALGTDPFELTEGSPAIDAADDSLTVGTQDVDGDARVAGSASDLGAQEFGAGPSFVREFMLY